MQPVVSICIATYNQEKYIAEAIESVLVQKTSFPVQLVIGEDYSTDKTYEICQRYILLHRNILLLHREHNLGLARNLALTWQECKGKYIAMLEGDDFWSSSYKLEAQVRLMEEHPEYSMCFTRTSVKDEDNLINRHRQFPYREIKGSAVTITDTIRHNLMANCSVMYRGGLVPKFPEWMLSLTLCDHTLHCLHLQHGNSGYIPEYMAVYRLHKDSAFESRSFMDKVAMSTSGYLALSKYLKAPYRHQARETLVLMLVATALYNLVKLPLKSKLTLWTIFFEELEHAWRVR